MSDSHQNTPIGGDSQGNADVTDVASHVAASAEFSKDYGEVKPELEAYREHVLDELNPSLNFKATMQRAMVEMVREEVQHRHRSTSPRSRVVALGSRWASMWRELLDGSPVFRWAHHGVLALGCGLILAFVLDFGSRDDVSAAPVVAVETDHFGEFLDTESKVPLPGDVIDSEPALSSPLEDSEETLKKFGPEKLRNNKKKR